MINFPHSTFTWKAPAWTPDPFYKYAGGFVGRPGQAYHVRFNLEAKCEVRDETSGHVAELFLGAPCRTEYTIASRNLFQVPSSEFRMPFSRRSRLNIAKGPSGEKEKVSARQLSEKYQDYKIDIREYADPTELTDARQIVTATLENDLLNARSTYRDSERGLAISVEYPVNLINLSEADGEFQVCTGPLLLPDLDTWDGLDVSRVFLAHAAFSAFDHVEFILQRHVEASEAEREWLDKPRGRDRLDLVDPNNPPPTPMSRPRLTTYNEVWERPATNVVLCAENR